MDQLNVMLLENRPGAGDDVATALADGGHAVHRCHPQGGAAFPCSALTGEECPLDRPLDAAVVVRQGVAPSRSVGEDGVACALRAGLPVVEVGTDVLDPYAEVISARVRSDEPVEQACRRAVDASLVPTREAVAAALVPFLRSRGVNPSLVDVELHAVGDDLHIGLVLDGSITDGSADGTLPGLLGVRALDTVRGLRRRWSSVEVATAVRPPTRAR